MIVIYIRNRENLTWVFKFSYILQGGEHNQHTIFFDAQSRGCIREAQRFFEAGT